MPFPMWKGKSSFDRGGGGDIGIIAGIVQDTMTGGGVIIVVIQPGIARYLMTGEITIEAIRGTDNPGIITPLIIGTWIDTGEATIGNMTMEGVIQEEPAIGEDRMVARGIDAQDN